jgi:hypothetical protein
MQLHMRRTLVVFVGLSLIAHLLILAGIRIQLPDFERAPPPLEARLEPAPRLPPVLPAITQAPVPRTRAQHKHKPSVKHVERVTPAPAPIPAAPRVDTSAIADTPAQSGADASAATADAGPINAGQLDTMASAQAAEQPAVATEPVLPVARRLPRKGQITYALYLGTDKFNVGSTLQSWEIDGDSYRLQSVSETSGLVAVFVRQRLAYESRGKLTARGLRPEHFTTERVRSGNLEKARADFDWSAASATVGNPAHDVALPANAQDIVSFMYQLGLLPLTPGRIELPITNGWKLERYELDVGREEPLETPFGELRAIPVKQVRHADRESIELWLAPAYRWLPVRIRFFNRDGEPSGEQLVSEIRVSGE